MMDAGSKTGRRRAPQVMYYVRRIHLYSGLMLFPWVLLYGITALLFNHPAVFSDQPTRRLSREDFVGTALEQMAHPATDAEQVVAALNDRFSSLSRSESAIRLVEPEKAVYSRDVIVARARGAGQEHSVLLDLLSGTAFVSTNNQAGVAQPSFATRGLKVSGSLGERVKTGLPAALSRQGLSADDAGIAIGAELVFLVQAEGCIWRATYHPQTGAVSGRPIDDPDASDRSTRRFLTQLHLAHGYPSRPGIRWAWALLVDVMFVAMVFWGLSGLLMWWQMKSVRVAGAAALIVSLLLATVLGLGMHRLLNPL